LSVLSHFINHPSEAGKQSVRPCMRRQMIHRPAFVMQHVYKFKCLCADVFSCLYFVRFHAEGNNTNVSF
jgi:hypothetical protein